MQHSAFIQLSFYNATHFEALNSYELDEIQSEFTVSVYDSIFLRKVETIEGKYPVSILIENKPIGYFVLDLSKEKLDFTEESNAILLRSLSLNPLFQGKGLGKQAMLLTDEFVKKNFPEIKKIVLSVNVRNTSAYQLYLKSGYSDSGRIFVGIKGPQHIMEKQLD